MYFPYLKGLQNELLGLKELVVEDRLGQDIIPIVEPVKLNKQFLDVLAAFKEKNHKIAIIINPVELPNFLDIYSSGDELAQTLVAFLAEPNVLKAYSLERGSLKSLEKIKEKLNLTIESGLLIDIPLDAIEECNKIIDKYSISYVCIPGTLAYKRGITSRQVKKILFEDQFNKQPRNADYLNKEDEAFSLNHTFYDQEGYAGFGDYSIIGKPTITSGFAPYAVAIHIVYLIANDYLNVHHFVSDSNEDYNDPAGKFAEAMKKLAQWYGNLDNEGNKTLSLQKLLDYYEEGRFPGLGILKRISIQHHLEVMKHYLSVR